MPRLTGDPKIDIPKLQRWIHDAEATMEKMQRKIRRLELGDFTTKQQERKGLTISPASVQPFTLVGTFSVTYVNAELRPRIAWTQLQILWDAGGVDTIGAGSRIISGLAPGDYYSYPYFDQATKTVEFVLGGSGTPAIAWATANDPTALTQQSLTGRVPLRDAIPYTQSEP